MKMKRKVGDLVLIKNWDTMVHEYGLNEDDDIDCRCCFTKEMRFLCGHICEIKRCNSDSYYVFDNTTKRSVGFFISDDMITDINFIIPL